MATVIGAVGHRFPVGAASANHAWEFAPEAEQAGRDLMPDSPLMIGAALNSDVFGYASSGLAWSADGTWLVVAAPVDGAYELWRVRRADGRVERLTEGEHAVTRPDAVALRGGMRIAAVRNSGTATPDVVALDVAAPRAREVEPASPRQLTRLMAPAWAGVDLVEPVSRWHEVDGRRIQGWFLEAPPPRRQARAAGRPGPRRTGHALRLEPDVGVAKPGGRRHQHLCPQPARLGGLRPGFLPRQLRGLGRRPDA